MISKFVNVIAAATVFLAFCGYSARAEFITNLTVSQTTETGNFIRYEYALTNLPSSDLPAALLALRVADDANLSSIVGPEGWEITYSPTETTIIWESLAPASNILPGTSATFSFVSSLGPGLRDYQVVGLDDLRTEFNNGRIATPSVTAVPEPTSMILLGTGLVALAGYTWHRRRRSAC